MAAFSAVSAASASAQSPAREPATVDIRLLESSLAEALHARDRLRLESLLASDYVLRGAPDINREIWLQNAIKLCWGDRISTIFAHATTNRPGTGGPRTRWH